VDLRSQQGDGGPAGATILTIRRRSPVPLAALRQ